MTKEMKDAKNVKLMEIYRRTGERGQTMDDCGVTGLPSVVLIFCSYFLNDKRAPRHVLSPLPPPGL
jgi:hypothetical protein